MTNEEKIMQYLCDNGLDISKHVDTYRHVEPGTVSILSRSIWGYGGNYAKWSALLSILSEPGCPIRMEPIQSDPTERPMSFDRLIWTGKEN